MSEDEVKKRRGVLGDWARSIAEAAVILAALFVFFWPVRVKGVSMAPSVNDGDRVIICRLAGYAGLYGRGDLVVFDGDAYSENMIKRVIAVGGDTLRISDGRVFVNGVESEYAFGYTDGDVYEVIPEGYVFVMGDNREKSVDSRVFGAVDTSDIYGRVILRFFPFDDIEIF